MEGNPRIIETLNDVLTAELTAINQYFIHAKMCGNWVRDRGVLSLEDAVNKLTKVQADIFGFDDRGVVAEGKAADLVVFDPKTVAPGPLRRVRDFPADAERLTADHPTGMSHLFVNGTPVIVDGVLQDDAVAARPGKVLRAAR